MNYFFSFKSLRCNKSCCPPKKLHIIPTKKLSRCGNLVSVQYCFSILLADMMNDGVISWNSSSS